MSTDLVLANGEAGGGDVIAIGAKVATELVDIIERQRLYTMIGPGKHVLVEGWSCMGAMLGITPREREVKYIDGDYEAYVELVSLKTGAVVGGASAICGRSEPLWAARPRNAQRSMAITRATGKAYRLGYSWIMKLAGYEPTPAEEMDHVAAMDSLKSTNETAKGFDATNAAHTAWLRHKVTKDGCPEAFEAIKAELAGKPRESVEEIIEKYRHKAT